MIPKGVTPVIGVRAYRMRERIDHEDKKSLKIFEQAKGNIEKEFGKQLSWPEYANWFAQTLGKNLAKAHNAGYWHGSLLTHNVTMACEIVDFGATEGSKKIDDLPPDHRDERLYTDFYNAKSMALSSLLHKMKELNLMSGNSQSYFDAYDAAYSNEIKDEYKEIIKLENNK